MQFLRGREVSVLDLRNKKRQQGSPGLCPKRKGSALHFLG